MAISGNQLKAARALVGFDQMQLAAAAKIGVNTVRNMEAAGAANVRTRTETLDAVEALFKVVGLVFIPGNGSGPGVRLNATPHTNDDELLGQLNDDHIWIISHGYNVNNASTLRIALEETCKLTDAGHNINSIRSAGDRIIIEPAQNRRLLIRLGLYR